MTARPPRGLGDRPSARITVHVWTRSEGTGVTALQGLLENAVREISMSAFQTHATLPTAWIAYSCPTITNVYANPDSQVRALENRI